MKFSVVDDTMNILDMENAMMVGVPRASLQSQKRLNLSINSSINNGI